jgi:hypothetical protein
MAVMRGTGMWNKFMPRKSIVTLCILGGFTIFCEMKKGMDEKRSLPDE